MCSFYHSSHLKCIELNIWREQQRQTKNVLESTISIKIHFLPLDKTIQQSNGAPLVSSISIYKTIWFISSVRFLFFRHFITFYFQMKYWILFEFAFQSFVCSTVAIRNPMESLRSDIMPWHFISIWFRSAIY